MNKRTAELIQKLRTLGAHKDAEALEKHAQLDDTPFIPATPKLKGYEPQLKKEQAWLRGQLPMSRSHHKKFTEDPRAQSLIEKLGGPEMFGFGRTYRDPASVDVTMNPEEMIERIRTQGWPPHGLRLPEGNITDVDPLHPVESVGPHGGKKYGEEFDFGEGANIGMMPEGSDQFIYSPQGDLDPDMVKSIQDVWGEGKEQFADNVEGATSRFNKRIESWATDAYPMLSTNFMTQLKQVITGGGDQVWVVDNGKENLSSVIMTRMVNVDGIKNGYITKMGPYADLQKDLFIQYLDDVNSGKDYPSEDWMGKLMLIYNNDMDLVVDNPLSITYPDDFLNEIIFPYAETKRAGGGGGGGPSEPLSWEKILTRQFQPITMGAEETAARRKMIQDVDIWKGLVSSKTGEPLIQSQKDVIVFNYNQELMHLLELLKDLQRMINIQDRFSDASLATAEASPEAVSMMDNAVLKFLRDLEQHYKQSELATAEGKLMGNYAVGSETKLEIYLKALYIIQAYDSWRQRLERGSISEEVPIEDITSKEEPGRLSDIEKIEADESMLPKVSSSRAFMLKIANDLDEAGMHELADQISRVI
jgi:hypothetical protein